MESKNEISVELAAMAAELHGLGELVSGISREMPYGIPAGYFDRLPALLVSRIAVRSSAFQVPTGYFEGFAGQVLARIKAGSTDISQPEDTVEAELARLSITLSRIGRNTPYQLPEGYFDELSPVLAVLRDKPVYQLPEGYFEELSPVLTILEDRPTYRVPANYFTDFPTGMLETVSKPVSTGKIIPMEREGGKVLKGHWWKYSSAAAIAACFLLIFSWPQVGTNAGDPSFADISQNLHKLSDQEIQAYLDNDHTILAEPVAGNSTATLDMNEGDVKSLLGEVSDNDLQQYVEEHGKANDIATN
jgi:hypothetical protein